MAKQTILDPFGVPHAVASAIAAKPAAKPASKPAAAPAPTPPLAGQGPAPVTQAVANNPFDTDPGYLAALAAEQAGSQQLDNALRAAQEQAIVQFGDPGLAGLAGFNLDPTTAAAAQANTQAGNSTVAQLGRQRDLNQQTIQNTLAAHGMVFSGDLGYKTGQNQQDYGTALYNQSQAVLQSLAGVSRDNLAQKQGLRSGTVGALTSAYGNAVQNPGQWGMVDDGGQAGALNAQATAPVTQAVAGKPKTAKPLAAKPVSNPFAARTAKNNRMG